MNLRSPDSQSAARRSSAAPRRAGADVLTLEELGERLRVSVVILRGMLETGGYFTGAWYDADDETGDGWRVPERAVRAWLGRQVEPLFTISEAAEVLRLHKVTVQKAVAAWRAGDRRGIAVVELALPGAVIKSAPRITLTELQRHILPARTP